MKLDILSLVHQPMEELCHGHAEIIFLVAVKISLIF